MNILKVVITDAEKAGEAIIHEVEALPSQIEHVTADAFKLAAKFLGSAAVQRAVALAKEYESVVLPKLANVAEGEVAKIVTVVEQTDAIAWVKEMLIKEGVASSVFDANSLAGLAWSWAARGISLVEGAVQAGEVDAIGQQ